MFFFFFFKVSAAIGNGNIASVHVECHLLA
jgi:hypothetical protein